jgi:hypothetical protein
MLNQVLNFAYVCSLKPRPNILPILPKGSKASSAVIPLDSLIIYFCPLSAQNSLQRIGGAATERLLHPLRFDPNK